MKKKEYKIIYKLNHAQFFIAENFEEALKQFKKEVVEDTSVIIDIEIKEISDPI